jgi:hypothetical protein
MRTHPDETAHISGRFAGEALALDEGGSMVKEVEIRVPAATFS